MPLLRKKLGWSDVEVSAVCLGTMTMGVQSNEEESHQVRRRARKRKVARGCVCALTRAPCDAPCHTHTQLLDYYVLERGGNFLDVAEMYPAPASDPRWMPGVSEEILGKWFAKRPEVRSKVILATKVMGFSPNSDSAGNRKVTLGTGKLAENGKPEPVPARLDRESILEACEASLKRLQTSYIDLYQLHWPDRYAPTFGALAYDPTRERKAVPFEETVGAMKTLIDAGKIKFWGLSNETTFGVCELVKAADAVGCPRPVSIQNQFSLLYRPFEGELAEACAPSHYNITLPGGSYVECGAPLHAHPSSCRPTPLFLPPDTHPSMPITRSL